MPIKFRCPHCRQFLGISRSKAGMLSDCPTCGRSIRVPDLDGRMDPVPEPLLNLRDERISKALDVLATLDDPEPPTPPPPVMDLAARGATMTAKPVAAAAPVVKAAAPPQASPAPSPFLVREIPPAPVRPPAPPASSKGLENALKELSAAVESVSTEVPSASRRPRRTTGWGLAAGGTAAGLALGFLIGRLSVTPAATAAPETRPHAAAVPAADAGTVPVAPGGGAKPVVPPAPAAVAGQLVTALQGQVTYTTENGESRPDIGARVLVFPDVREGAGKLPVVGFLAGAGDADARLSKASLRALGGDYAVADAEGKYEISLPAAGAYRVLIVSRYQEQVESPVLETTLRKLLDEYFDRPNRLVGQGKYHFGSVRFDGQSPTNRSHAFTR
ncbi:hypothetical protein [Planctomyces sp. SH-PL14]|uniref:hypothetical protein n=1 Tax=Planctomyces sp. SH-PL14 TaxID=1632864 RepID=UPI00078B94F4|nr:hypothetical protein [Planctomyces sp. SH-PL14]AMV21871.1 hypothetical protein VT03_28475 [Planctomyces sp. SH-PL14]